MESWARPRSVYQNLFAADKANYMCHHGVK